jgi:Fantastic Four meristem regulator
MTSYIQTTQFHQERLNHQVLSWVLPISIREEANDSVERETECNGAKWSTLYSLCSTKESVPDFKANSVPSLAPILKISKSGSKNSLDMCTERLGCENGTMYTTDDYKRDSLLSERIGFLAEEEAEKRRRERKAMLERRIRRVKTGTKLPPVLTTRTRENCLNIVRERENGRMVMYAVRQQSTITAERRDGRLKLRLLSSSSDEMKEIQDENERTTVEEVEGEEGDYLGVVGKEMNGNENGGDEMEGRKYVFVGRCKEEEMRDDWKPLMVASAI